MFGCCKRRSFGRFRTRSLDATSSASSDSQAVPPTDPELGQTTSLGQELSESQTANVGDRTDTAGEAFVVSNSKPDETTAEEQLLLDRISHLVDEEYDFLLAEGLLAELEDSSKSGPRWDAVLSLPVFDRFRSRMQCFTEVGNACFADRGEWFQAYEDSTKTRSIHVFIDPADGRQVSYRVRVQIPTSLRNVVAVANEVELLPEWNKLVTGPPEIVGRRTAHYLVLNYQMSFLGGFKKVDICNEIYRFSDVRGGFVAEHIETVPEGHPNYRAPKVGCVRPKTLLRNVWVACGPEQTVFIQAGKLTTPFAIPSWLVSKLGSIAGRSILDGLVRSSLQSSVPGNPWEELLTADRLGLYSRISECIASQDSQARRPPADGPDHGNGNTAPVRVADFDLRPQFDRRPIQRMDPSTPLPEGPQSL